MNKVNTAKALLILGLMLLLAIGTWLSVPLVYAWGPHNTHLPPRQLHGLNAPQLVAAARSQIGVTLLYDPAYTALAYPMGDVPMYKGVCTDVVIRALRTQHIDLQTLIHKDMKQNFSLYPTKWGLRKPDSNIDHRRVPNIELFLQRKHTSLKPSLNAKDYLTGDLVSWRIGRQKLPHIGIVSDRLSFDGTPLIIHNIGLGTQEDNVLFDFPITGHFRW